MFVSVKDWKLYRVKILLYIVICNRVLVVVCNLLFKVCGVFIFMKLVGKFIIVVYFYGLIWK